MTSCQARCELCGMTSTCYEIWRTDTAGRVVCPGCIDDENMSDSMSDVRFSRFCAGPIKNDT